MKYHYANLITILINIGITALVFKLYTEFVKDVSISKRGRA